MAMALGTCRGLGCRTASIFVPAFRPLLSFRFVCNICLNSASVYTEAVLTPEGAFVAGTPPGQGELIVGHLMVEYNS